MLYKLISIIKKVVSSVLQGQLLSSKLPLLLKDEQNLMVLMGSDT